MTDIVFPAPGELAARLRQLAGRSDLHSFGELDDLELNHLVAVASNHSLLLEDSFDEERLGRLLGWQPGDGRNPLGDFIEREDLPTEAIRQAQRIPDDIKALGDKCLYDVGLFGRHEHRGHNLVRLGQRSYQLASDLLELLSDDRRLREYFQQNRLVNLPIEEEIIFLRQCGARFSVHAALLKDLGLFDRLSRQTGPPNQRNLDPREDTRLAFRPVPKIHNENPTPPSRIQKRADDLPKPRSADPRTPMTEASGLETFQKGTPADRGGFAGGMMEERPEFLPEELGTPPGIADMNRLPRKDLLSLYERMLLFSSLDINDLREDLNRTVIDQEDAVETLCDELSLYAIGTQNLRRPASYLFVGPTGVGKNHLVESLVVALEKRWDLKIPVLQLEGPQYTYPSDINELKGAARGFIRSDEEGILTEFYGRSSQSPFSVILVDEVEKSHPQLRRFFLSLMDRGTTMDNRGQQLNFINSMIVYTSNIGYSRLQVSSNLIGFNEEAQQEEFRNQEVIHDLKRILTPEFLNRLAVIRFGQLSQASIEAIFDLEIEKIAARYMAMHGIELTVTPRARLMLIEQGYSVEFGARPMARLLNRVCNIEVSKKLRRDEVRSTMEDCSLRDYIREVKDGKRAYDPLSMQRRVMSRARVQVPYRGIAIDYDGGQFLYLPLGEGRGTH